MLEWNGRPAKRWILAVLRHGEDEILLCEDGKERFLPELCISTSVRPVPEATTYVAGKFGIDAPCLMTLRATVPWIEEECSVMVLETSVDVQHAPKGACWAGPHKLAEFGLDAFWKGIARALDAACYDTERRGWWRRLMTWAETPLRSAGLRATGRFEQWNAGSGFQLVRLETEGQAVWFKAVGPPLTSEFTITRALATGQPQRAPQCLAAHEEWHGWLMLEAEGVCLRQVTHVAHWQTAARAIARLQMEEAARAEGWLEHGCRDLRPGALAANLQTFCSGMEAVMGRQPHVPPVRLGRAELARMADGIAQALTQAEALPSSLVHADLNPGNIFVGPSGCRFLDWAEASVAHSFVVLDNLLGHRRKQEAVDSNDLAPIQRAYAAEWEAEYGEAAVRRALRVTRLLRLATMALRSAGWVWGRPTSLQEERRLRSLCRSLLEEIGALSRQEVSA